MNTADFSVLPDELVVSLNPLRRGAQRARVFCARVAGLAMPWNASGAGLASGQRVRASRMPARWPFPPAPVQEGDSAGNAVVAPAAPIAAPVAPVSAPAVAPATPAMPAASAVRDQCLGDAKVSPAATQLTMKAMVTDVLLVLAWGAMIPGLMWLGVAGGF